MVAINLQIALTSLIPSDLLPSLFVEFMAITFHDDRPVQEARREFDYDVSTVLFPTCRDQALGYDLGQPRDKAGLSLNVQNEKEELLDGRFTFQKRYGCLGNHYRKIIQTRPMTNSEEFQTRRCD